jgi:hypothetical protein
MFGNKYAGDELALELLRVLESKKISKVAQSKALRDLDESRLTPKQMIGLAETYRRKAEDLIDESYRGPGEMPSFAAAGMRREAEELRQKARELEAKAYSAPSEDKMKDLNVDSGMESGDDNISAEDFLDLDESEPENIESDVEKEIEGMESFIDDKPILAKSPLKDYAQNLAKQKAKESDAKDHVDDKTAYVLRGLGKIAGSLKLRGENFAADVVEATALNIKKEALVKEAKKQKVVATLNKIAKSIDAKGDTFTADVVRATMLKIKNASSYSDDDLMDEDTKESDDISEWVIPGLKELIEDHKSALDHMDLPLRKKWLRSQLIDYGFDEMHAEKITSKLMSELDFESADVTEEYDFSTVDFEDIDISDDLDFEEDGISDEDLFDYLGF